MRTTNGFEAYLADGEEDPRYERHPPKIPVGHRRMTRPRYRGCHSYHYNNPCSQNALICETPGFPDSYDPATHSTGSAYSDRLQMWDGEHYAAILKMAGTGEQGWQSVLPEKSAQELKEFVQFALKLPVLPEHVRVVHHFNVSNGYSCPTLEAIYRK